MAILLSGGCDGCGERTRRVDGPWPHVRCIDRPGEDRDDVELGDGRRLVRDGRRARLELPEGTPVSLLVAAGPAPGGAADPSLPDGWRGRDVGLVVLGGLGDDRETARETLGRLLDAAPGALVVVIPGGRDRPAVLDLALAALPRTARGRVVEGSRTDVLSVAAHDLVLVPGAPDGRYAIDADACGVGADDLERLGGRLAAADGRARWLVSWAAPTGAGAVSLDGVDAGWSPLRRFVDDHAIRGGVHAWPALGARPSTATGPFGHRTVPRYAGPASERGDGGLVAPGWTRVVLGDDGQARADTLTPGG